MVASSSVAPSGAARDRGRRQGGAGAGPVLDHERLPELFVQLVSEQPRDQVGRAARGKRHHEGDGALRILRGGGRGGGEERENRREDVSR